MLGNYVAFAALIWMGTRFTSQASWLAFLGGGLLGAILFYLITNSTSWLHDPAYPKTLAGWIQALTVGTPGWPHTWEFFRNTLLSGGLFSGLFAGAMKLGEALEAKEQEQEEEAGEPAEGPEATEPEETKA
jgi:peptidoglycan/LPS O-acetylase OafA/YrhL